MQGPIYIALFDYEQRTSEDLSFRKGAKLEIINAQVSVCGVYERPLFCPCDHVASSIYSSLPHPTHPTHPTHPRMETGGRLGVWGQ